MVLHRKDWKLFVPHPFQGLVVEIDLVPLGQADIYENSDGQILVLARVVLGGQPVQTSRSRHDCLLLRTRDWYLHSVWQERHEQAMGRK